jgi:aminomuconate-semialdehyde/2-hydroxymuconate-6-semialdehyde dehydrogenase
MQKIYNYINGALCPPSSDSYMPNVNPATAETYSWIPDSDERDVELAVRAAEAAFPAWSQLSASKRSEFLLKIAKKINEKMDALALAESIDNGKPLSLAKAVDIPRAEQNFSFFATAILKQPI